MKAVHPRSPSARPYQPGSPLSIRTAKLSRFEAGVVLRWGTTREGPVLRFLFLSFVACLLRAYLSSPCFVPASTWRRTQATEGKKGKENAKIEGVYSMAWVYSMAFV